ncbi:hypothetical protein ACFL51_00320 [Myxococcota bacterium]
MIDPRYLQYDASWADSERRFREAEAMASQIEDLDGLRSALDQWWSELTKQLEHDGPELDRYPDDERSAWAHAELEPPSKFVLKTPTLVHTKHLRALDAATGYAVEGQKSPRNLLDCYGHILGETIGLAVGRAAQEPTADELDTALALCRDWLVFRAFAKGFDTALKDLDEEQRRAWWKVLVDDTDSLDRYLGPTLQSERADKIANANEEWKSLHPFDLWSRVRLPETGHFPAGGEHLHLLLIVRPERLLHAVDLVPLPEIAPALFRSPTLVADQDLLVRLLAAAPAGFDAKGSLTGRRAIFFLLPLVLKRAEWLERWSARELEDAEIGGAETAAVQARRSTLLDEDLPSWFRVAFQAVLGRPDGQFVAIGYAAHLLGEIIRMRRDRTDQWFAPGSAMNTLADLLSELGCSARELLFCVRQRRESAVDLESPGDGSTGPQEPRPTGLDELLLLLVGCTVLDRHLQAVSVAADDGDTAEPRSAQARPSDGLDDRSKKELIRDRDWLWEWYEEMLLRDGYGTGVSLVCNSIDGKTVPVWVSELLAGMLERRDDLAGDWNAVWSALAPKRRRDLFPLNPASDHFGMFWPSKLHIHTGLRAIARNFPFDQFNEPYTGGSHPSAQKVRDQWDRVFQACRWSRLTRPIDPDNDTLATLVVSTAWLPVLRCAFTDPASFHSWVADMLKPVLGDPFLSVFIAYHLRQNELELAEVHELFEQMGFPLQDEIEETVRGGWSRTGFRPATDLVGELKDDAEPKAKGVVSMVEQGLKLTFDHIVGAVGQIRRRVTARTLGGKDVE